MTQKNRPQPHGAGGRITIRFGPRDSELFDWLFFGQHEDMSRVIKRALYQHTRIPGGDYLGVAPALPGSPATITPTDAANILNNFLASLARLEMVRIKAEALAHAPIVEPPPTTEDTQPATPIPRTMLESQPA